MQRSFAFPLVRAGHGSHALLIGGAGLATVAAIGFIIIAPLGAPTLHRQVEEQSRPVTVSMVAAPAAFDSRAAWIAHDESEVADTPSQAPALPDTRIIRTGSATLRTDRVAEALARADSVAGRLGGFVVQSDASGSDAGPTGGSLTLRVPSGSWPRLIAAIERLGRVERLHVETQDVGEEYVDVEARLANGRRLESRLIALIGTRTGKLSDVLQAERELARVRDDIDGLIGRQRYLDRSVAMSTLNLAVVPAATTAVADPGMFRSAARDAWTSFIWLIAFAVRVSGVVIPLVLLAVCGWWIVRRRAEA